MSHRSATTLGFGTRTNSSFAMPSGTVDNDLLKLILAVQEVSGAVPVTPPPGFVGANGYSNGTVINVDPASFGADEAMRLCVWLKRAKGESGADYVTGHGSVQTAGILVCHSGRISWSDPTDNPNASGNSGGTPGGGNVDIVANGVTVGVNDTDILFTGLVWNTIGATTPPAGMTELMELIAMYVAYQTVDAGATGTRTITSMDAGGTFAAVLSALEGTPTGYVRDGGQEFPRPRLRRDTYPVMAD